MALDPYALCPCGSGKKFKWCCQPVHAEIEQAFDQAAQGQIETALRLMDEVVARHPGNPVVHGQKARMLYGVGQRDEAENVLQQALDANPNYPFGYFLRGQFRHDEGEFPGALILYRKALDLYDPSAGPLLAEICTAVVDCELKLNRPVAARAALQLAVRHDPQTAELRQGFEQLFGPDSVFPEAARREYTYLGPPKDAPAERRAAWEKALGAAAPGKLSAAASAFEELTAANADDAPAWYNLGLTRAWLGDNTQAVEALDRYVNLETDEAKAGAAWTLAEVLRCGHGMEKESDYVEYSILFPLRDPQRILRQLDAWGKERRLVEGRVDQEQGIVTGVILQPVTGLTPEHAAQQSPHLAANLIMTGNMLRLSNVVRAPLDAAAQELHQKVGPALGDPHVHKGPPAFREVVFDALVFPINATDQATAEQAGAEGAQKFYEEQWLHKPRIALQGVPPIDAAGHGTLRKKLRGVVQFLQDCAAVVGLGYDFDRLRRKLGLLGGTAAPAAPEAASPAGPDFTALSAAELSAVSPESLTEEQLEQAYQAALKLDARELAGRFARAVTERPPSAERPDRYSWYIYLIGQAQTRNNLDEALDLLNQGEKADCEHNEGRRRNDYELRRAQLHARRGELDQAQEVFDRLIQRVPDEVRYRASAAEAMLSARQGGRALRFAEEGLAQARQQNNRDSEQHFLELVAAAKKQGG